MKDSEGVILFIVGLIAACAIFWGVITAIRKSFSMHKPDVSATDTSEIISEQRRRMQDIEDRQKRLMEDQKQRMRDLQRR